MLVTWIGTADLRAPDSPEEQRGPLARILDKHAFDHVLVLSDWGRENEEVGRYIAWVSDRLQRAGRPVPPFLVIDGLEKCGRKLPGDIYDIAAGYVAENRGDCRLSFNVSSGLPKMQTALYLLAATQEFDAEIYEASQEQGVRPIKFPFLTWRYTADVNDALIRNVRAAFDEAVERTKGEERKDVGDQPPFRHFVDIAKKNTHPVLIIGESGTGKRRVAREIHKNSGSSNDPRIIYGSELCGPMLEASKLQTRSNTYLIVCDIDIIHGIAQSEIIKLSKKASVRIIATSSRDLWEEVRAGRFREDLHFFLSANIIEIPPLRERRDELPQLCAEILKDLAQGSHAKKVSPDALDLLRRQEWPGNIRELQSVLTRTFLRTPGAETIEADHIVPCLFRHESRSDILARALGDGFRLEEVVKELERHYVLGALEKAGGNQSRACELLGFEHRNLGPTLVRLEIRDQVERDFPSGRRGRRQAPRKEPQDRPRPGRTAPRS